MQRVSQTLLGTGHQKEGGANDAPLFPLPAQRIRDLIRSIIVGATLVAIATIAGTVFSLILAIMATVAVNQTRRTIRESDLKAAEEKGVLKEQVRTLSSCVDNVTSRMTTSEGAHNELRNDVSLLMGEIRALVSRIDEFYKIMDRRHESRG